MVIRTNTCLLGFIIILILPICASYSFYRQLIPNGVAVPHPCPHHNMSIWRGVGHFLEEGAANRNSFGVDFRKFESKWTKELCEKDSDGDGKSNGEELGDPQCVWKPGSKTTFKAKSHPGICEPITSNHCIAKNHHFNICKTSKCGNNQDSEIKEFVLRLPTLQVPEKETTYTCMYYNLSNHGVDIDKTYHIIGFDAVVNNVDILHHILLHKCDGLRNQDLDIIKKLRRVLFNGSPSECGKSPRDCSTIITGWSIGLGEYCLDKNVGLKIGKDAMTIMALQFHWSNPKRIRGSTDNSGIRFYYVEKLRRSNAESITLGVTPFEIHPGIESCTITADCRGLNQRFIYITSVRNHMHQLGKEIRIEHRRHSKLLGNIAEDRKYSYNSPHLFNFSRGIEIREGDNLKLSCCYSSLSRTTTTHFGVETSDEMCFAMLLVYPYENVVEDSCSTHYNQSCQESDNIDFCTNIT